MMTIRSSLLLAAAILAIAFSLKLAVGADLIEPGAQKRAVGVVMGIVLVLYSNAVPKTLEPLSVQRCEPSKKQALQRFTGWTLVIAGVGYALAWLFLPLDLARVVAMTTVAIGVFLVLARLGWTIFRRPSQPTAHS